MFYFFTAAWNKALHKVGNFNNKKRTSCVRVVQIVPSNFAVHKRRIICFKLIPDNLVSVSTFPGHNWFETVTTSTSTE